MKAFHVIPVAILVLFTACKKDEVIVEPTLDAPLVSYAQETYEADFMIDGSTEIPDLDWNGDVGNLSLAASMQGVELNPLNGVITWDGGLPLGENDITVIATNSNGQSLVPLTIRNPFSGHFDGGYNFDPNSTNVSASFAMSFGVDGDMTASDFGFDGPGTYTMNGNKITAIYSYDNGDSFVTVEGELDYDKDKAIITGFFYYGEEAVEGEEVGYVEVEFVP